MKASFIANDPIQNIDPKIRLINELRQKVASLEKQLMQANNHIEMLSEKNTARSVFTPNKQDPESYPTPKSS